MLMPSGILPPELKAVEGFLSGDKTFTVSKYQRNFSWTKDEVQELIDEGFFVSLWGKNP
jgi:uncharacterized protein with ParB-like and HNH nuclease domain